MEALISSENEEKRAVLDRFAAMENEVTSLRSSNADLHRKLNDVEAGLHELGRENQSLLNDPIRFNLSNTPSRMDLTDVCSTPLKSDENSDPLFVPDEDESKDVVFDKSAYMSLGDSQDVDAQGALKKIVVNKRKRFSLQSAGRRLRCCK